VNLRVCIQCRATGYDKFCCSDCKIKVVGAVIIVVDFCMAERCCFNVESWDSICDNKLIYIRKTTQ